MKKNEKNEPKPLINLCPFEFSGGDTDPGAV